MKREIKLLTDMDCFYDLAARLKHTCGKLLSNYYMSASALTEAVRQGKITYVYKENAYLNLWYRNGGFERLYYFIADPGDYEIIDRPSMCVCDVICRVDDQPLVGSVLHGAGMREYVGYAKWICRSPVLPDIQDQADLEIMEDDDGNLFVESLYQYFDIWSDQLPERTGLETFTREKHFIGVHERHGSLLVGGLVYTEQGYGVTEEYLFVLPGYRGRGISRLLHNTLYRKYQGKDIKYTAWIRKDNQASTTLHSSYQYKKQNQLKITFLKGEAE